MAALQRLPAMMRQTLGHYRIIEKIGEGGMGVVYRAQDERLDRDVALKVLPPGLLTDEGARKRFRKEALALAKLTHPNIATIYDFDTQNGIDFLVTEYIPGVTLSDKVSAGPLPDKEILRLGMQLAEGLAAAHAQNIVHCDLKPANLRIIPDGRLKILDFGLAKLVQPVSDSNVTASVSETRAVAGTLPYMAPEQLQGEPVDSRTDIYATGVVLYEMATGQRAFREELVPRLTDAILHRAPEPPSTHNRRVSAALESLILKALEKEPERRHQTARDLLADFLRLSAPSGMVLPVPPRRRYARWLLVGSAALIALLAILFGLNVGNLSHRVLGRADAPQIRSLAVLPLENLSGDPTQEYFADGMTEELITDLAEIGSLKVISRTSAMHYKGVSKTLPQIARELDVDAVVEGSIQRSGQRVRITAQLIRAATDQHLWAEAYERDARDVLTMEEEIAKDITNEIRVKVAPEEKARLASVHPLDPRAHEAYLKGRFHLIKRTDKDLKQAAEYFQEAIHQDSSYADAYNGLGYTYYMMSQYSSLPVSEARAKAEAAIGKALEIDPALAGAHDTLAIIRDVFDRDWTSADREYRRAIELNPNDSTAHEIYSMYLAEMGQTTEAIGQAKRAQGLDPLSLRVNSVVCWQFYFAREYDDAVEAARKTFELDPDYMPAHWCAGVSHEKKGNFGEAIAELQKTVSLAGNTESQAWLAYVYAAAGQTDKALEILHRLLALSKRQYVSPYQIAEIYTGLGDMNHAFEWWNKAQKTGFDLIYLTAWPANDTLRSDVRYKQLLERVGLPR